MNRQEIARRAKGALRRALRGELGERAARALVGLTPSAARAFRLYPQHTDYAGAKRPLRLAERGGLLWVFELDEYFQWHQYFELEDRVGQVLSCLAERAEVFFDVGANIGFYAVSLSHKAPSMRVFAFEAHPRTAERTAAHIALNHATRVELVRAGVSDRGGSLALRFPRGGDHGKSSFRGSKRGDLDGCLEVPVVAIDDFVRERGLERLDLIKIDVEGHEAAVIAGAQRAIERLRPAICFEYTPAWCEARAPLLALERAGYTFFPIEERLEVRGVPLIGAPRELGEVRDQVNLVGLCLDRPRHAQAHARLRALSAR